MYQALGLSKIEVAERYQYDQYMAQEQARAQRAATKGAKRR